MTQGLFMWAIASSCPDTHYNAEILQKVQDTSTVHPTIAALHHSFYSNFGIFYTCTQNGQGQQFSFSRSKKNEHVVCFIKTNAH